MAETLGAGSGRPGATRQVGDFSVAGVATRVVTVPPTDADWGDTPPPNGTMAFEDTILWVRVSGTWKSVALDLT